MQKPREMDGGRLEFAGLHYTNGRQRSMFVYHPPRMEGLYVIRYRCVDAETGKGITREDFIVAKVPPPVTNLYDLDFPAFTNIAWRVNGTVDYAPSKGIHLLFWRLQNVMRTRDVKAWKFPIYSSLAPVYSCWITNPLPSTASP